LVSGEFACHDKLVERPGNLDTLVALNLVTDLNIVIVLDADTALRTRANLVDIVLEAT